MTMPHPAGSPYWPEADLLRRLLRVLAFAASTVRSLAVHGYTDTGHPEADVPATKVIAETGLLLLGVNAVAERFPALQRAVADLAMLLRPHARGDALRVALCMRPALARDHGLAHVCLSAMGYPDAAFDRLYQQSIAAVDAGGLERVPYRAMEQRWIDRVWSGRRDRTREDLRLARESILGRSPGALIASREDVYALTHALFYVTDLGEGPVGLPRSKAAILQDAETALARCLDTEDYDLGGEVLLAWPLLRCRWSASASFAFRVLARVEDTVGFLPAASTRVARFRDIDQPEDRKRYLLATAYHTAYVMGMLCAMMLRPDATRAMTAWNDARRVRTEDDAMLRALLRSTAPQGLAREPHWLADLDALPPRQSTALTPLLLTVALQRAARSGEIDRLRMLLQTALRLHCASGPAAREAVRVLRASTLLGEPIPARAAGSAG